MGNPSDGFYGKTIAMSISNFWAEVSIQASKKLVRHQLTDIQPELQNKHVHVFQKIWLTGFMMVALLYELLLQ